MYNIAIFASGTGSNALKIIKHFEKSAVADVNLVLTNRENAGVIGHAEDFSIDWYHFNKDDWENIPAKILDLLNAFGIDFIILAGFLLKVPGAILTEYSDKILNIHPALLPDFGGKGMYGMRVHRAVIEAGKTETGITIHKVNAEYDKGEIIFQKKTEIELGDTPESIQKKVQKLEHQYFPEVIENYLNSYSKV